MDIKDKRIDDGKAFDWGRTSAEYARYRDIYPEEFYRKIVELGLCIDGQKVLDLGTGTGVLPRNMYRFGAKWLGTDISPEQIEQAKILSAKEGMDIDYMAVSAEDIDFPEGSFDVVTACQCFWYFDHETLMPKLSYLLKDSGKILVLFMSWLRRKWCSSIIRAGQAEVKQSIPFIYLMPHISFSILRITVNTGWMFLLAGNPGMAGCLRAAV